MRNPPDTQPFVPSPAVTARSRPSADGQSTVAGDPRAPEPRGSRLWTRVLLFATVVTGLAILASIFLASRQLELAALEQAGARLDRAAAAIDRLAEGRFARQRIVLEERVRSLAPPPEPLWESPAGDPVASFLATVRADRSLAQAAPGATPLPTTLPLEARPLADAFEGVPDRGLWHLRGKFYEVMAVPWPSSEPDRPEQVLISGREVRGVVDSIRAITGAEVLLLFDDEVVESSLAEPLLEEALGALKRVGKEPAKRVVELAGQQWLLGRHDVPADLGDGVCRHVVLFPLSTALRSTRAAFRDVLVLGGAIWLGVVLLAAFGARRLAAPLSRLTTSLDQMARAGAIVADFPAAGGGREISMLEATFRRLARRLLRAEAAREASYREAISAIVAALDARDHGTYGHSLRVAGYAVLLARAAGLEEAELPAVEWGALLHDVGKIAVPDAILGKPGRLDPDEWEVMRRHPEWGRRLVSRVAFLCPAVSVVAHHHERWDGGGYPAGESGEDIPVAARIFAVVDTYDAMTSDRPYRPAHSHGEALAELRRVAGSQLEARLVEVFCGLSESALRAVRDGVDDVPFDAEASDRVS